MEQQPELKNLKPMGWGEALLYFGVPAAAFFVSFHYGMPAFETGGMLAYDAYLLALGIPLALMLAASFVVLKIEGYPLTWEAVKTRFRLKPMDGNTWLWVLGVLVLGQIVGTGAVSQVSKFLIAQGIMPVPDYLPAFMDPLLPADQISAVYNQAVGGMLGNWKPFIYLNILLFFNIFGEEFWWRGVVLPRQELHLGKHAWWVHGLMWAVFHIFKWWDVLSLVPVTLALSLMAVRKKNTTPGIIIHYIINGFGLVPFVLGALGVLR